MMADIHKQLFYKGFTFDNAMYDRIGSEYLMGNRIDDALYWLKRGRELDPNNLFVNFHLAHCYMAKGEDDLAYDMYKKLKKIGFNKSDHRDWAIGEFSMLDRLGVLSYKKTNAVMKKHKIK